MLAQRSLTWPTSDGYNLDNRGSEFQVYFSSWLNEAKSFDELKTDLIARRFVTGSIIDFDTDEPFPAMGVGGNVAGILTHSASYILELEDDTTVALKCSVES